MPNFLIICSLLMASAQGLQTPGQRWQVFKPSEFQSVMSQARQLGLKSVAYNGPQDEGQHLFDGNGEVKKVDLFCNQQVRFGTHSIETEYDAYVKKNGKPGFNMGSALEGTAGLWILLDKLRNHRYSFEVALDFANTSLLPVADGLLALQECNKPYLLKDEDSGTLTTEGVLKELGPMGAHFKADPHSSDLFHVVYNVNGKDPYVEVMRFNPKTNTNELEYRIDLLDYHRTLVHDLAVTQDSIVMILGSMVYEEKAFGKPFHFNKYKNAKLIRIDRRTKELSSFDLPPQQGFHFGPAIESDGQLKFLHVASESFDMADATTFRPLLREITLDLNSGEIAESVYEDFGFMDFPTWVMDQKGNYSIFSVGSDGEQNSLNFIRWNKNEPPRLLSSVLTTGMPSEVMILPPSGDHDDIYGFSIFKGKDKKSSFRLVKASDGGIETVAKAFIPFDRGSIFHGCWM